MRHATNPHPLNTRRRVLLSILSSMDALAVPSQFQTAGIRETQRSRVCKCRPNLCFQQTWRDDFIALNDGLRQKGSAWLIDSDCNECGGINISNFHSLRSSRNPFTASGRCTLNLNTDSGDFAGMYAPRFRNSSKRSLFDRFFSAIGRISATGFPR